MCKSILVLLLLALSSSQFAQANIVCRNNAVFHYYKDKVKTYFSDAIIDEDKEIRQQIENKICASRRLNSKTLTVNVKNKVATIYGSVPSENENNLVVSKITSSGVKDIINRLSFPKF